MIALVVIPHVLQVFHVAENLWAVHVGAGGEENRSALSI